VSTAAETRELKAFFIDGGDERLKRRYMESRWLHPSCRRLSDHGWDPGRAPSGSSLRDSADLVIDTSVLTVADLKHMLTGRLAFDALGLRVLVASFAYRHGLPRMPIRSSMRAFSTTRVLKLGPHRRMAAGSIRGNPT
jgi:RNase adaptor protein for sRNA GlmZ degradation